MRSVIHEVCDQFRMWNTGAPYAVRRPVNATMWALVHLGSNGVRVAARDTVMGCLYR